MIFFAPRLLLQAQNRGFDLRAWKRKVPAVSYILYLVIGHSPSSTSSHPSLPLTPYATPLLCTIYSFTAYFAGLRQHNVPPPPSMSMI